MFTAKLEAKTWKKIIHALYGIIDEAAIRVTKEGLKFIAMDPSHISMVDFCMAKEHFDEYVVTEEISLGLDIDETRKIINRSKPDDILTVKTDENRITFTFKQRDAETVRRFGLPLIDIIGSDEILKIPTLETTATIKLPAFVLNDCIKDANIFSDNIILRAEENIFLTRAEGDSGKAITEIKEWLEYSVQEKAQSAFNLSYLTDIAKSIEDEVTIDLGNKMPLKLTFTLDNAEFMFILAPRVEKE